MAKKSATLIKADPTLPTRTVSTAEGDIRLCLDFGALMDAEAALIAGGHSVELLMSLQPQAASALRTFFVIASRRYHPELSVERAEALVTMRNIMEISAAVAEVWKLSMAEPKPEDGASGPIQAVE